MFQLLRLLLKKCEIIDSFIIDVNATIIIMYQKSINFFLLFFLVICLTSCVDTRKTTYFNDLQNGSVIPSTKDSSNILIQRNDILSIVITSLNPEASSIFNAPNTAITNFTSTGSNQSTGGYLVNSEGLIQLPILGNFRVAGLTKKELKEQITSTLTEKKLLTDPIVTIRHLNFEITIIGEVTKPSVITIPNEKISLIKALGLAGDITIYGKKDNVLLIREISGKRNVTRLDLNSPGFLSSPYYFLQPNDIVYVEANKNKVTGVSAVRQALPILLSALSVLLLTLQLIKK